MIGFGLLQNASERLASRRGLSGYLGLLSHFLVVAIIPFLLIRGLSLDSPLIQDRTGEALPVHQSAPSLQSNGEEEDVCHPLPLDPDPSEDASGMAIHIDTHVRKDSNFRHFPAKSPLLHLTVVECSAGFMAAAFLRDETPALPFPEAYPVFLISDIPPPAA
jgi:hypothetical protein